MAIPNDIAFQLRETLRRQLRLDGKALIDATVEAIDAILPQTQCRKCQHPGCKPYARAIVDGEADINQCPPGGAQGIYDLAALLGQEFKPLSPLHGVESQSAVAIIDEATCIGCTLCIAVCPVDAIVGAAKQMHTIIAEQCTGCELCLPPCPVDCIRMETTAHNETSSRNEKRLVADIARERYEFHQFRQAREIEEKTTKLTARSATIREQLAKAAGASNTLGNQAEADAKDAIIAAAIARARLQRNSVTPRNTTQLMPEQGREIEAIESRRAVSQESSNSSQPDDTSIGNQGKCL